MTIDASGNDPTPESQWGDAILDDDGDGSRVFNIDDGDTQLLVDVSISGLGLTGGDSAGQGGAIWSFENLTLDASVISGNAAREAAAISIRNGDLVIQSSIISGNMSQGGIAGAMYAYGGDLTATDTTISGNTMRGGAPEAGIIYVRLGNVAMTRTTISGNSLVFPAPSRNFAALSGGNADLDLNDCVISNNLNAGGIQFNRGSDAKIHRSIVSDNGSRGISIRSFTGSIEITGCEVSRNGNTGVSVLNSGGGTTTISHSTISGNTGVETVGMSHAKGGINAQASEGGLITISDCSVFDNTARTSSTGNPNIDRTQAGGIFIFLDSGATASISRSSIYNNKLLDNAGSTSGSGGGITLLGQFDAAATITDSNIYGNQAQFGGGVMSNSLGSMTILRSTVSDNRAVREGGGVHGFSRFDVFNGKLFVIESTVSGNSAATGGGIFAFGSNPEIIRSTISGNTATEGISQFIAGDGGGIWAYSPAIVESTIDGNTAFRNGGGIWAKDGHIVGTTMSHNSAQFGGGAWLARSLVEQSTVSSNVADVGGGIYASISSIVPGTTTIRHSTVAWNQAASPSAPGSGIFAEGGIELDLDHTIVANGLAATLGTTIDARYSLIVSNRDNGLTPAPVGSPDANGNIIGNWQDVPNGTINARLGPLADNGGPTLTHALLPGSPAIDAGDPAAVAGVDGVPVHDQRGEPFTRIYGGRIDMGAVEALPAGFLPGDFNGNGVVEAGGLLRLAATRSIPPPTCGPMAMATASSTGSTTRYGRAILARRRNSSEQGAGSREWK